MYVGSTSSVTNVCEESNSRAGTHVRGLTCKHTRVLVWAAQEQLVHFKSIYWM